MKNFVEMAQDRILWRTSVMMVINFHIPWQQEQVWSSGYMIHFSRKSVYHGDGY